MVNIDTKSIVDIAFIEGATPLFIIDHIKRGRVLCEPIVKKVIIKLSIEFMKTISAHPNIGVLIKGKVILLNVIIGEAPRSREASSIDILNPINLDLNIRKKYGILTSVWPLITVYKENLISTKEKNEANETPKNRVGIKRGKINTFCINPLPKNLCLVIANAADIPINEPNKVLAKAIYRLFFRVETKRGSLSTSAYHFNVKPFKGNIPTTESLKENKIMIKMGK